MEGYGVGLLLGRIAELRLEHISGCVGPETHRAI